MARAVLTVVLGLAAAAVAQYGPRESVTSLGVNQPNPSATTYTGPMFNPSNAPNFGPTSTFNTSIPIITHHSKSKSTKTSHHSSHTSYASHASNSTIHVSSSASIGLLSSTVTSATSGSGATTTTTSAAQVSTAAAQAKYAGFMGSLAGGVFAGLALV